MTQTLEALTRRIRTTEDLKSIVRTMKALSAASIQTYERAASAVAEYQLTIELGLQVALRARPFPAIDPDEERGPAAAIVFGSDHGLCGRFNDQVVDFAIRRVGDRGIDVATCRWLAVGLQATARLDARGVAIARARSLPGSVDGLTDAAAGILTELERWRADHEVARVLLFHNGHEGRTSPEPRERRLLPLDRGYLRALRHRPWRSRSLPAFTMDPAVLLSRLVRQHLFVTVYRAGAESMAAEHATRLATMQTAERNIAERLDDMTAEARRERQSAITSELLDVIAGYEAVGGADSG